MNALIRRRTAPAARPWRDSPSPTMATVPTASPHSSTLVPHTAHPSPRAIRVQRSPR